MIGTFMSAYSSRLQITVAGERLSPSDPRVPQSLRGLLTDQPVIDDHSRGYVENFLQKDGDSFQWLLEIMTPILQDMKSSSAILPDIDDSSWCADPDLICCDIGKAGLGHNGIAIQPSRPVLECVVDLARQLQEWEIDALLTTNQSVSWPRCPIHPDRHPLSPELRKGHACWCCPVAHEAISDIGMLLRRPAGS
jgi:hypothetical protein